MAMNAGKLLHIFPEGIRNCQKNYRTVCCH
jgi:hypothetical protein